MSKFAPVVKIFGKGVFFVKKHSPEILTGLGLIGVTASGVMLVRAGMKTPEIVEYHKDSMTHLSTLTMTDSERRRETYGQYANTAGKLFKVYSAPVLTGIIGVSCIVGGHGQLRKRNFAYAAAYKSLEETFQRYKKNVEDVLGEEAEKDISKGVSFKERETETGEIVSDRAIMSDRVSDYARIFDVSNKNWQGDPDYNVLFLKSHHNYLNDLLQTRGHVTLNDVYDSLGFERTKAGQIVGWLSKGNGDGFIDFGIDNWDNIRLGSRVDGIEGHILLDFNVDGPIYDKL